MSWDLATLRREGMRMESALRGGAEITGESVNRLGKFICTHEEEGYGAKDCEENNKLLQLWKSCRWPNYEAQGSMPSTKCEMQQMWQSRTLC
jgi:hypothetical protein